MVSATTLSRTRHEPADRRRQLLDAALAEVEESGLDTLTPAAVAARSGASKALVFHYFGSTVKLRRTVALDAVTHLDAALRPSEDVPLAERPELALAAFLDSVTAHRRVWEDVWRGALASDDVTQEALEQVRSALVGRMTATAGVIGFTPSSRLQLLARGWVALVENVTAGWLGGCDVARAELERLLLSSLVVLVPELPEPARSAVLRLAGPAD
ncbi:TetR family transcriptional regulator [Isoptericola sp. 4D.3]|uniref:TetR family transcriptional regulator n=1 Tax=Isoptericola peretonis TaxID=2918523 RepID=A0ABT0J6P3_9MICO|nr:TetR family transcriptional regulator [Isoptericola sp. 4D.3]